MKGRVDKQICTKDPWAFYEKKSTQKTKQKRNQLLLFYFVITWRTELLINELILFSSTPVYTINYTE